MDNKYKSICKGVSEEMIKSRKWDGQPYADMFDEEYNKMTKEEKEKADMLLKELDEIIGYDEEIEDQEYFKTIDNNGINNYKFYKKNIDDIIWWIDYKDKKGEYLFTFDKKRIYNLFRDYPYNLTNNEKEIFDKENPYWKEFFNNKD